MQVVDLHLRSVAYSYLMQEQQAQLRALQEAVLQTGEQQLLPDVRTQEYRNYLVVDMQQMTVVQDTERQVDMQAAALEVQLEVPL